MVFANKSKADVDTVSPHFHSQNEEKYHILIKDTKASSYTIHMACRTKTLSKQSE